MHSVPTAIPSLIPSRLSALRTQLNITSEGQPEIHRAYEAISLDFVHGVMVSSDQIVKVFHYTVFTVGLIVNGTLIYLILSCKRKDFGSYKYLLALFATLDINYGVVHSLVYPIPECWGNAFYMAAFGPVQGRWAVSWFALAHSLSFPVLSYHFLYRLFAVRSPNRFLPLFSQPWFIAVLAGVLAIIGLSWFSVGVWWFGPSEFGRDYLREIICEGKAECSNDFIDQYAIAVYWENGTFVGPRWRPLAGVSIIGGTMLLPYCFIGFAAVQIYKFLKTMFPLITAYTPTTLAAFFPLIGVEFRAVSIISPPLCSLHPLLDGCIILYTVREYRRMLIAKFGSCFKNRNAVATSSVIMSKTPQVASMRSSRSATPPN